MPPHLFPALHEGPKDVLVCCGGTKLEAAVEAHPDPRRAVEQPECMTTPGDVLVDFQVPGTSGTRFKLVESLYVSGSTINNL